MWLAPAQSIYGALTTTLRFLPANCVAIFESELGILEGPMTPTKQSALSYFRTDLSHTRVTPHSKYHQFRMTRFFPQYVMRLTSASHAWLTSSAPFLAQAVNTFVGQVAPSGQNQLTGTLRMDENGYHIDAQNQQVKDLTIGYGPEIPNDPVRLGTEGPGNLTYVQDPSLEGRIAPGVNVQLKAKAGYHFVAVSFGVGLSNFGRHTEGE